MECQKSQKKSKYLKVIEDNCHCNKKGMNYPVFKFVAFLRNVKFTKTKTFNWVDCTKMHHLACAQLLRATADETETLSVNKKLVNLI